MHNEGDGTIYWIQGTLEKRMDKYNDAKMSGWTKNRFKLGCLSIINNWGERKPLPETIIVNITPDTAWSLGTERDLATLKKDDLSLKLEPDDIPCDDNGDDDEINLQTLHCYDCDVALHEQ